MNNRTYDVTIAQVHKFRVRVEGVANAEEAVLKARKTFDDSALPCPGITVESSDVDIIGVHHFIPELDEK